NPKIPKFSKRQIYDFWKSGHSFILPLQEYQKEEMVDIISALEIYYGSGTANLYCSPCADSKSFPQHADSTENFLVHVEGKVKWTLYNEFGQPHISEKIGGGVSQSEDREYTIMNEYELEAGDLLYIPRYQYHKALSLSPRISISIHFHERKSGQPKKYTHCAPWFSFIVSKGLDA
ncbi:MAG: cupin domain-containing protein, partial [Candidatus Marinimicrobia bacterium]|nr:cupin domain-containing protein [Candidatus Neomarinimicrobiota bacterium]